MILQNIANCAGFFVEFASARNAKRFRHRDLYAFHIIPVPDGLEESVRKTEEEQIFDLFLAQIMVNAKNGRFRKDGVQRGVEFLSRSQIAAKGLFEDYAGIFGAACSAQTFYNRRKHAGRN